MSRVVAVMVRTFRDWMWRVHLMMSVKNVYPFITVANLNCRTLLLGIPFLLLLFQVLLTLRERTQAINLPIHLVDLPVLLPIRLPPLIMMCLLKYFKTPTSYSQFRRRFRFVLQSLCYPDSIGYQVFILHRRFRRPIPPVSFLRLNICTHRVYHEVSLRPRVFRIRATHPYRWLLACHPVYRLHLFLLRMHHLSPLHHPHHTTPYPPLPANLNAHAKHPNPLPFLPSFPVPTLNSTTGEIPLVCILLLSHLDYRERCDTIQRILSVQSDKQILQNSIGGGLGHKYISIEHGLSYALILGWQYKSMTLFILLSILSSFGVLEVHSLLHPTVPNSVIERNQCGSIVAK